MIGGTVLPSGLRSFLAKGVEPPPLHAARTTRQEKRKRERRSERRRVDFASECEMTSAQDHPDRMFRQRFGSVTPKDVGPPQAKCTARIAVHQDHV